MENSTLDEFQRFPGLLSCWPFKAIVSDAVARKNNKKKNVRLGATNVQQQLNVALKTQKNIQQWLDGTWGVI